MTLTEKELTSLVERLCREPHESEWLEFKEHQCEPQIIGEYLSALANGACLAGKPRGYLVFGIRDLTHQIVGTQYDPYSTKAKGKQDLLIWLATGLQPKIGFEVFVLDHPQGRLVLFSVSPATERPVLFWGKGYIRIGASKTDLSGHPAKERAIWTRNSDWTGEVCEGASFDELDPNAVEMARQQFRIKHPQLTDEIDTWDTATLLNKAHLTVHGAITNAAILLLGRPETSALLSPAQAKMSWILKDESNRELDYQHFGPPYLLHVDQVLLRIRNLNLRTMPGGTLFPQEITQYDPWVIREALHNAIAHQDYGLHGRVNIVETPSHVLITNRGSFLPGDIDTVIRQDAPLEIYRNPFLAEAMVNLNMIDTQGGGIKRMFQKQRQRFLPMPDYLLDEPARVKVTIPGNILDEEYTRLLMERTDLELWQVILLDRVQKHQRIPREAHLQLKSNALVEGRYPNLFISADVARLTGRKAIHIRERGFNKQYYLDAIESLIREHQPIPRSEIDRLLLDKLPEVMTQRQRKARIHNLLTELVRLGRIQNRGTRGQPAWHTVDKPAI